MALALRTDRLSVLVLVLALGAAMVVSAVAAVIFVATYEGVGLIGYRTAAEQDGETFGRTNIDTRMKQMSPRATAMWIAVAIFGLACGVAGLVFGIMALALR